MEKRKFFFFDYLSFGTNLLTKEVSEELLNILPDNKNGSSRFYMNRYQTEKMYVESVPRMEKLPYLSFRIKKEFINYFLSVGLPYDLSVQRVDFAIDCDSFDEAIKFVVKKVEQVVESAEGKTFYFGKRDSPLFERVYFLNERGFWRYEAEFKPRAGRANTVVKKLHPDAQQLWKYLKDVSIMGGARADLEKTFFSVSRSRRDWIDLHLESEFVKPTHKILTVLNSAEREYFFSRLRASCMNVNRFRAWLKEVEDFEKYVSFNAQIALLERAKEVKNLDDDL